MILAQLICLLPVKLEIKKVELCVEPLTFANLKPCCQKRSCQLE